jgi:hypothetical protein
LQMADDARDGPAVLDATGLVPALATMLSRPPVRRCAGQDIPVVGRRYGLWTRRAWRRPGTGRPGDPFSRTTG